MTDIRLSFLEDKGLFFNRKAGLLCITSPVFHHLIPAPVIICFGC